MLFRKSTILFLILMSAAACGTASKTPLPFEAAGPSAAPDPLQPGPFPVGVKTLTLVKGDRIYEDTGLPRTLLTEVWYPAVQSVKEGPFFTYELWAEVPESLADRQQSIRESGLVGIQTRAVRDAPLERSHGPYPVILFSHGANGIRWQSTFYTVHLASHGFVVVAVDHERNTIWDILLYGYDPDTFFTVAADRLEDMPFVLDRFTSFNENPSSFFHRALDLERVGISGHSFGGFTAASAPCRDPRFKAVVLHAPLIGPMVFFGCSYETYPVPIMVMQGTKDDALDWRDTYCDYYWLKNQTRYLYELDRGGHYTFSDMCALDLVQLATHFDFGEAEDALTDGCSPTLNPPWDEAQQTINHYATAFFNQHLRGSPGSQSYLVERSAPPFHTVTLHEGQVPDWPGETCGTP